MILLIPDELFAQFSEGKCYCCGKSGDSSNKCIENNKSKRRWWINFQAQNMNIEKQEN